MIAPDIFEPERLAGAVQMELVRRAREAQDIPALQFIVVNDTYLLAPYRQAALWLQGEGVKALSGVIELERNAPYVQWMATICERLSGRVAQRISADDLALAEVNAWSEWLPAQAIWIPMAGSEGPGGMPPGGVVYAREAPWDDREIDAINDWVATWRCMYHARALPLRPRSWLSGATRLKRLFRRNIVLSSLVVAGILSLPVPLTILAPGELVPANPVIVRAPLDGVVSKFHVQPNQLVKKDQRLFDFDDIAMGSRYEVAAQALATAEAELRQVEQQGMNDTRARAQLPSARGSVAERQAELALLGSQRARLEVRAPQDGYILFDDPTDWIGRPVTTGERILRLASPDDREIEAWVGVGDAIPLAMGAGARLYLSASPLDPVVGRVRYLSHEPVRRPDGLYAYRARATLEGPTTHRVGLKGTVRLTGETVTLAYWLVRRPMATIREFLGI